MLFGASGFADAADKDDGEQKNDEEGGNVEAEVPTGLVNPVGAEVLKAAGEEGRRDPFGGRVDAEPVHEIDDVRGEADRDAHVGAGVFEDQIPADDPGDELAHGGVGVGVGGAGDGDHAGELGVTEAGESTDDGDEDERERQRGACAWSAGERGVVNDEIGERCVEDGRGVELFAGDGGANDGEDAGADDRADAEGGE